MEEQLRLELENAARLIRQYLIAKERGRADDAAAIWDHLASAGFKLNVIEKQPDGTWADASGRGFNEEYAETWPALRDNPGITRAVQLVRWRHGYLGREPVARIVADRETRAVSVYEVPLVVPEEIKAAIARV